MIRRRNTFVICFLIVATKYVLKTNAENKSFRIVPRFEQQLNDENHDFDFVNIYLFYAIAS